MTAAAMTDRPAYAPKGEYRLTGAGLLRSEWTKLWSLRSTWIVLLCAVVFAGGLGALISGSVPTDQGFSGADMSLGFAMAGVSLSSVFIAVLGILTVTGEYSTGSIRSTMSAAPRRLSVLWSKAAVYGAVVAALFTVMVFATFFLSQALFDGTALGGISVGDDGVLGALLGYVAMIVYLALLAIAIGAILRNSAGSIGFYIGVIMILPELATLLPWNWVSDVTPYAPGNVPNTLLLVDTSQGTLGVGESWLWMGVWLVVAYGLAAVLLKRRDV
ncbi:ABC transporter permease [Glycomyces albidus]|jgi:ABC-type transport system involved in multi-copper enzyme maturation permease subunit|uniref:ABC transporter permease subunit n=1 Tax=Glycomyces albidus TaxID=2656774 RepID=A0A6L5G3V3_9ACTN|nr:ABC transporter permease subunit [Glycomyces albidus]MQM24173.1 ABC transporter permease subunit [Glycomyces albidus]